MKTSKFFGLDIGINSMKVVWLSEEKGRYSLSAASTMPTPQNGMSSESSLDLEEIAKAIRTLVQESKITTPMVNLALPENKVYTKILEMPVLSDKEISTAIYWEAEQYIPVPLTAVTLDWKVLQRPKDASEGKMQVLLVGAPTDLINKYQKVMDIAGLTASAMETETLSVIRAVSKVFEKDLGNNFPALLIIHVGAVSTLLSVVRNGVVAFTYVIPIGGTAINRAIASDFGFTLAQADEYKRTYGYSSKSFGGKIGIAIEPILQSILSEVKKLFALYSEKYKNEPPIRLIAFSGGTAKLPGLDIFFVKNTGLETLVVNPWKVLVDKELPKELVDNASDYTVAMGLAMRGYE